MAAGRQTRQLGAQVGSLALSALSAAKLHELSCDGLPVNAIIVGYASCVMLA